MRAAARVRVRWRLAGLARPPLRERRGRGSTPRGAPGLPSRRARRRRRRRPGTSAGRRRASASRQNCLVLHLAAAMYKLINLRTKNPTKIVGCPVVHDEARTEVVCGWGGSGRCWGL